MKKPAGIFIFAIMSMIMGAAAGALVWITLKIMDGGMHLLWDILPKATGMTGSAAIGGDSCGSLIYDLAICLAGGLLIGLWQNHHGIFPESLEEVMVKVKRNGGYPYDKIHILLISALLPLIFGGAIGPEAGLTGVIAGVCTLIGDRLKYKGDQVRQMAEAGLAACLGVIFAAPLFGIVGNLEDYTPDKDREPILSKGGRTLIYIFAVAGAMGALKGLSLLFGGMAGLPRFSGARDWDFAVMVSQWKWGVPLIIAGILAALIYVLFNIMTKKAGQAIYKHRIISCMIAGLLLGIAGHFCGSGRFSGEDQMDILMENWQTFTWGALILMGLVKLLMVNISVNLGWKGGTIFPMIYSAVAVGYGVAAIITEAGGWGSLEGTFAVAVVAASMLGFLMRKPVTVIAVLLLCFPITFLPALAVAAFISAALGGGFAKASTRIASAHKGEKDGN